MQARDMRMYVGDTWRTRGGNLLVEIIGISGSGDMVYPVGGKVVSGGLTGFQAGIWTLEGRYYIGEERDLDLVSRYSPNGHVCEALVKGVRLLEL